MTLHSLRKWDYNHHITHSTCGTTTSPTTTTTTDNYATECASLQRCRQDAVWGAGSDFTGAQSSIMLKRWLQVTLDSSLMHLRTIYPQETHTNHQTGVQLRIRQLDQLSTGWATGSRYQHKEKEVVNEWPTTKGSRRSGEVIITHDHHASETVKRN